LKSTFISEIESIRLDKYLTTVLDSSRNQIEQLIKNSNVLINNVLVKKPSHKMKIDDEVEVNFPEKRKIDSEFEVNFDIPIIYEDDYLMIINKPANVVVHSAPSVREATVVDWLKKNGFSLSTLNGDERHGIVHRLDKGTTGAMLIAKDNETHRILSAQLEDRTMGRYYVAISDIPLKDDIIVEANLGRSTKNRLKMAVTESGRYAKTLFKKFKLSKDEKEEIIFCKLFTGRTHQIRVHLESLKRHIIGDSLYGFKSRKGKISNILLHAHTIYFKHPKSGEYLHIEAEINDEMLKYIDKKFLLEIENAKIQNLHNYFNSDLN